MSDVDEDNLDGVTREELVRAQIAKHKELLTPPADVVAALGPDLAAMHYSLSDINNALIEILDVLRTRGNHRNVEQFLITELVAALEETRGEIQEQNTLAQVEAALKLAESLNGEKDQNENKS